MSSAISLHCITGSSYLQVTTDKIWSLYFHIQMRSEPFPHQKRWPKFYKIMIFKICLHFPWISFFKILFKNNIQGKDISKFWKSEFHRILVIMAEGRGCKDTFDFGVETALISFVYEGIDSKFCLWLPVTVSMRNTIIYNYYGIIILKVRQKVWYTTLIILLGFM